MASRSAYIWTKSIDFYAVRRLEKQIGTRIFYANTNERVAYCCQEARLRDGDRAKFVDLANKRVSKAMTSIRIIGNLSNRSNYDYTEEDVAKIFRALHTEISACKKRFELALKKQGNKTHFVLE